MSLLQRPPMELVERIAPLLVTPLHVVERKAIESAMILCQGNVSEAAKRLAIGRTTLIGILKRYRKEE
jgi:DNA-binding NtrC family response regulator